MKSKMGVLAKMRFGLKTRIGLYERIAAFLKADIDIVSTLRTIKTRYDKKKDYRGKVLAEWIKEMDKGAKFSDAIKEWTPAAEHMLISAGERGKGLISGLEQAVVLSTAASKNKNAIIAGLIMPVVLITMIFLMLIGFQVQMAPVFIGLLPLQQWPSNAQVLYNWSKFFYDNWFIILCLMGVLGFIISATMNKWVGRTRKIFDKIPPWSIYKGYQGSSFLIALSSLMQAGIANYECLKLMDKTASPWMKSHLSIMKRKMNQGGPNQGEALNTGLLDDETAGDIEDYSRLGSFQDAIFILGSRSLEKSVAQTKARMAVLTNFLLICVAGGVLTIYFTSYNLQTTIAEQMSSNR